ncbi:AAA family ATPase [Aeromicrobium duanguangcaii]|uniref:P-loop NTPase n=1 Tax=Aeromicrobium duanguangcaii TaxID=2968086 RepID=A0ABY5KC81_9ACTN|nr:P-loop NTPase [Aeromicrobium duanguangcaii]MCD9154661.1 P-loop NTPase [Aeromicrobium duanguangcaii]UUI67925.1 P-loop NTPase [Aeromicrobium duanguangcaii]
MSIIVVITESSPFAGRLRRVADRQVVGLKPTFTEHALNSMLGTMRAIDLVVICEDVDDDQSMELADIVHDHQLNVPVVLVREQPEPLSTEQRQSGVVESVSALSSDLEIERLLARHVGSAMPGVEEQRPRVAVPAAPVAPVRRVDPEEHRVVVVLSPKGGVGKTTISTNLAIALSRRTPLDTVIIDFDSQFGDVASVLNINAQHTLEDAFTEHSVHPPLVVKGLLNAFDEKLLVLAASESPAALEKISPVQESDLLRQLSDDYAFVVVDTGSGLTDETMAALEVATDVIMVTTMDVSSVKALRRAADLLDRIDLLPRNRHLVVNMTESGTGLEIDDIAQAMQMPVDVSIARSVDIALSVNTGRPLAQAKRSAELSSAVDAIVAKLRGETTRRKGGLFRRDE